MAGTSYTRQSTFADGDTITAALFNTEFNKIVSAFAYASSGTTGHQHDGGSGEGGNIEVIGDQNFLNKILVDSSNNRWGFFVEVSGSAVEQIRIQDGAIVPVTDSDIDLGTSSLEFKDLFLDGTAHIDTLDVDANATIAGTLGVTGNTTVGGTLAITGNTTVGGTLVVTGTTTFNGGTLTLGDAASDNVVFGADVNSNIIPNTDSAFDLGSSGQEWRDLYLDGTAHIDTLDVDVNATVAGTLGVTGVLTGTSLDISGNVDIDGVTNLDVVDIDGAVDMASTLTVTGVLTGTSLDISGNVDVDGTTNLDVVDIDGAVNMATTLIVTGNVDFDSDLDVDGTTNLDVVDIDGAVDMASTLQVDGAATFTTKITANGGIALADNDKATFGTGNDLEIYHDASNSYITDVGTGNLKIGGANVEITTAGGTQYFQGAANVAKLFHTGNERLATSSSGVTVGGTVTATGTSVFASLDISGDIDVDGTTNLDVVDIDGAVQLDATLTIGANDQGYDVILYGDTASANVTWDTSADDLIFNGGAGLIVPDGQLTLASTAITSTAAELNILDGVTSTAAELNILDGVTSTAAELNALDGITAVVGELNALDLGSTAVGTAIASKAVILDSNKDYTGVRNFSITGNLSVGGTTTVVDTVTMNAQNAVLFEGATADAHETTLTIVDPTADRTINLPNQSGTLPLLAAASNTAITSTPEELNILDGVTSTAAELNALDGITAVVGELNALDIGSTAVGTAVASKAVILDSNKDYTGIRNLTISGELDGGSLDISGDADIDGTTNLDVVDIDGAVDMASTLAVGGATTLTAATAINANIENPLTINSSLNGIVYSEVFNTNTGANAATYFGIVTQNLANSGTIRSGMFFDSINHLNLINGEAGGAGIVLDDNNAVTMSGTLGVTGKITNTVTSGDNIVTLAATGTNQSTSLLLGGESSGAYSMSIAVQGAGAGGKALSIRKDGFTGTEYMSIAYATGAATFSGSLAVTGALSGGGMKAFKIDHPLKPDTHDLVHSVIEAPQADLLYSGVSDLVNGSAEVNIDEYHGMTEGTFVALNRNIRVLTTNESDWEPIKGSVAGNILSISCQDASCSDKVSWLVIGERQDDGIKSSGLTDEQGRVIVEPLKPEVPEEPAPVQRTISVPVMLDGEQVTALETVDVPESIEVIDGVAVLTPATTQEVLKPQFEEIGVIDLEGNPVYR